MIGQRIRDYRKLKKWTMSDLASKIGISQGSISDIENSKTKPSSDTLENLVRYTDISPLWLLAGEGQIAKDQVTEIIPLTKKANGTAPMSTMAQDNQVTIPKFDMRVSAGFGAFNSESQTGVIMLDRRYVEKELNANVNHLTAITVAGDSMEPTLHTGDVVIVDNTQTHGDGIFIVRAGDLLYIKRMQTFFDRGIMRLTSDNGFYEPMELDVKTENIKVVGRAICCLRKM